MQCSGRVGLELSSVCAQALTVSILQDSMVGIPSNCALISADSNLLNDNMAVCLPPYLYFGDFACLENAKLMYKTCNTWNSRCPVEAGLGDVKVKEVKGQVDLSKVHYLVIAQSQRSIQQHEVPVAFK